jgi:hypothetical protein
LKYDENFEMLWNFINFEICKIYKNVMKFLKFWNFLKISSFKKKILNFIILIFFFNFQILYEIFEISNFVKFSNFQNCWPFLQFDWPTGNEITSLVGQRWNTE